MACALLILVLHCVAWCQIQLWKNKLLLARHSVLVLIATLHTQTTQYWEGILPYLGLRKLISIAIAIS